MNTVSSAKKLITKLQKLILGVTLGALLFVLLHTFVHNTHEHIHDASCGVYVLEQLYFAHDSVGVYTQVLLFVPFSFVPYMPKLAFVALQKHFSIRAPPAVKISKYKTI